jgi:chaperonin GroEL
MSQQKYLEGIKARDAYFKGADTVAKVVRESIGPFGLNLATEKGKKTTNDGYLISQSVSLALKDEFERQGALMQHESSTKTNDKVADATSTTIVLNSAIRKELLKYLPTDKRFVSLKSVESLKKQLEEERAKVIEELKKDIKTIDTLEDLRASALVSVEDKTLANLIADTQWELGKDGRLIVEEVNEDECGIEKINGILLDNGFATSLMINNPKEHSLEVENGYILLTNHMIRVTDLEGEGAIRKLIMQAVSEGKNNIAIFAQAFDQKAVEALVGLHQMGIFVYPINAPYVNQSEILQDIECVTGGKVILQDNGSLDDVSVDNLGRFSKIKMRLMGGVIAGIDDNVERKEKRIADLKAELEGEQSFFAKRKLEERIAALAGKLAFLKIGAYVKDDRERLKDKADDAVVSVRMAWNGGTVKGAGIAFKEIADTLPETALLKNPLQVVYNQIKSSAPEDFVIEDWVRDPFITLETALRNACEGAISMARVNGSVVTRDTMPKDLVYEDNK